MINFKADGTNLLLHALILSGAIALLWPCPAQAQRSASPSPAACRLEPFGSGTVSAVIDGRTFVLADGREVRIASIEVPLPDEEAAASPAGPDDAGAAARAALAAMTAGRDVDLQRTKPASDRYGRVLAFAVTVRGGMEVGREMVARGHAQVAARPGESACMRELLAVERKARAAQLGLWGDPRYVSRRADHPTDILAGRGRFTLVEGRVVSVRESGGTIYVNFGRRWTEDFTVTIAKRNEKRFAAAGVDPKTLAGRRVAVRGWVEERGGPWIEAFGPEQIEIITDR
jgi:endonuclease YncB( thermonuclease family)